MIEIENCWGKICNSVPGNLEILLDFTVILLANHFCKLIIDTSKLLIGYYAKANLQLVVDYLAKECQVKHV